MDDSDQDLSLLCSKLLKRVRRKAGDAGLPSDAAPQPCTQTRTGDPSRKRRRKKDLAWDSKPPTARRAASATECQPEEPAVNGDAGLAVHIDPGEPRTKERIMGKVLLRIEQFKRVSSHTLVHKEGIEGTLITRDSVPQNEKNGGTETRRDGVPQHEKNEGTETRRDGVPHHEKNGGVETKRNGVPQLPQSEALLSHFPKPSTSERRHSDEELAIRLQQELDREAAEAQVTDLEDRGLFFCQLCHRDLSHMTPEGRTQHLNRCLDEGEVSAPPPHRPPPVPNCPICGKKFKSKKSRTAHLKRCSSEMGVSPAVLLQCLQRQDAEAQSYSGANQSVLSGGSKRKGPSESGLPVRKKPRKKSPPMDEVTMLALALSSSLLEQEKELERRLQSAHPHTSMNTQLQWKPETGKGRGKRKKVVTPRPPPLLLIQDPEVALRRRQERVAALLLHHHAPSPPTPTRPPSRLQSALNGASPLWEKSALREAGLACPSEFYTPELREFLLPGGPAGVDAASVSKDESDPSTLPPPAARCRSRPSSPYAALSPGPLGHPPLGSQALRDLMELAEEGMTLSQWGYAAPKPGRDLQLSGFVPEECEERAALTGFIPDTPHTHAGCPTSDTRGRSGQLAPERESTNHRVVALSKLSTDLGSMVNNPQLSDVQIQVDSGEVYFVHSFIVYARCPLLAQMVNSCTTLDELHDSGFGVQEEGMAAAQRVLLEEVPGDAVLALLQFLYTARCLVSTPYVLPYLLDLATRLDLEELQELCQHHQAEADTPAEEEVAGVGSSQDEQRDQAFVQLLRSMWCEEVEDWCEVGSNGATEVEGALEDDGGSNGRAHDLTPGDEETTDDRVNEEEMEEIYEFAATQRKRGEEVENMEWEGEQDEEEEDEHEEREDPKLAEDQVFTPPGVSEPEGIPKHVQVKGSQSGSRSLDLSYDRLFPESWSIYEEEPFAPPASSSAHPNTSPPPQSQQERQQRRSPGKLSSRPSDRTCLQSSASVVIDLSTSPPPLHVSNVPLPGSSPSAEGEGGDGGGDERPGKGPVGADATRFSRREARQSPERESRGPCGSRVPGSSGPPLRGNEPELIVLSDSGDERVEVDVAAATSPGTSSPSPSPPFNQNLQNYTQIKPPPDPRPCKPVSDHRDSSSADLGSSPLSLASGPDRPGSEPVASDYGVGGFSPEVSWLIPDTPTPPGQRSNSISTQTHSSICRTHLFSEADPSSSPTPPAASSSRASQLETRSPTRNHPARDSLHTFQTDERGNRTSSRASGLGLDSPVLAFPPTRGSKRPQPASFSFSPSPNTSGKFTPLHGRPQPYSSTPLHADLSKSSVPPVASPLCSNSDREGSTGRCGGSGGLGSLRLSSSEPSHSSPHGGPSGDGLHSRQFQRSLQSHSDDGARTGEFKKGVGEGERGDGGEMRTEGEQEELISVEVSEPSFHQNFMDPPMAFNDSWGLDAGAAGDGGGAACFSLRLEDSGGGNEAGDLGGSSSADPPGPASTAAHPVTTHHQGTVSPARPSRAFTTQPLSLSAVAKTHRAAPLTPSPPDPHAPPASEINASLLDPQLWDSLEEEEEQDEPLPLSQRWKSQAQLKTPVSRSRVHKALVPITPMPSYSDMDTPELKNKLNRFGVRPLPKRQMILKLKEIHQYTHQLVSSDSEDDAPSSGRPVHARPVAAPPGTASCAQVAKFKQPTAPTGVSPVKQPREEDAEPLSASQGSNTSSTAASDDSERTNPELCRSSDSESDSDGGVTASQAVSRHQDRLKAVRAFIESDPELYSQILQYQPLVLSELQARLRAAGICLGAAKLLDYLDSQCITLTTAKPSGGRRGKGRGAGQRGMRRKAAHAAD